MSESRPRTVMAATDHGLDAVIGDVLLGGVGEVLAEVPALDLIQGVFISA
jgi:hypothetical protein